MRPNYIYIALASASLTLAHGGPAALHYEHPGEIFNHTHGSCCVNGIVHSGNSTGYFETIGGESLYLSYPPGHKKQDKTSNAIIYFTDIFGVQLVNNRLLGDSLAHAGYFVVMPDLFKGDPVPLSGLDEGSTFNMTAWRERHPQAAVEAIIESTLSSMRGELGVSKIGATGYCFGGKYVARFLAEGRGVDVGFTAHPSGVLSEEWEAVAGPISIAFGSLDAINPPENRTNAESIFEAGNKTFQTALYSGAEHGFAVRTNLSDKQAAFAQESAYFQAVRWLDTWIKDEE